MKPRIAEFLLCAAFALSLMPLTLVAQDFHRTYPIRSGGSIKVRNISGQIKISGYNGNSVEAIAYKEGSDTNEVQVADNSRGDNLDLGVRYPYGGHNVHASINFVIRVPQSSSYTFEISSVSGDVELDHANGRIKLDSVSGDVRAHSITGTVNAHSVSGDVRVEIQNLRGSGDLKFSSISGDIFVMAPPDMDADVKMSTISGDIRTDFPLFVRKPRYGPGRSVDERLGSGKFTLHMSSVSGNLNLHRK